MKLHKVFIMAVILFGIFSCFDAIAIGPGLVTGPEAREWFESERESKCWMFLDFEGIETGLYREFENLGIFLKTTQFRYPLPVVNALYKTPVAVLPYSFIQSPPNHRLMGVREGNYPDGQSKYEIVFDSSQRFVGLFRKWNTYSITRFYNHLNFLLAEHRNTSDQEFVGYLGGYDNYTDWVSRVEFDGLPLEPDSESNKLYMVGEVDDLFYSKPSLLVKIEGVPHMVKLGETMRPKFTIENLATFKQDNIGITIVFYSHEQKQRIKIDLLRNFQPHETKTFEYVLPINTIEDDIDYFFSVILVSPTDEIITGTTKNYYVLKSNPVTSIINHLLLDY